MSGIFITLEGPDGSGKTTVAQKLVDHLRNKGYPVTHTREPGGTPVAEKIREILLNNHMYGRAEVLMFAAARIQHYEDVIRPALAVGRIVISDRFADSTYAYQAGGRGLHKEALEMEKYALNGFEPNHTLFFNITLEESLKRLKERAGDKLDVFEKERNDFRQRVYEGYLERFKQNPHRMVEINAMPAPDVVLKQVTDWADTIFPDHHSV